MTRILICTASRRSFALAMAMALAGCAGVATAPATVSKAVAVACPTSVPPVPVFPADTLTGDEDIFTLGTTLWADIKARKAYEIDLSTRLAGCVAPDRPP